MALLPQLFVVFLAFTGLTEEVGVLPDDSLNAALGETVMFSTTLTATEEPFIAVTWAVNVSKNIITSTSVNVTNPDYEGRITFFPSTKSLELRDLALNDTGSYSVTIILSDGSSNHGSTNLMIYEKVSNVLVTSSSTDLVEFSGSVTLSCSSSGSPTSFRWFNGSSEVSARERVQLTDGGSNLTIINVTRFDQGPFTCHVSNLVSNGTSDPINLSISYGPENTHLIVSPSQEYFAIGLDINLNCSAGSRPPAQVKWFLNGVQLPVIGSELRLMNIQMNHSGNYSCEAFNSKTLKYQTAQPSAIIALEKISGASVKPPTNLPVEGTSVILTCEASGSIFTRNWMKDGSDLTLADNMTLSDNNRVLTFNTVKRKDKGEYFCEIGNPISSDGAKYVMIVNYGPENVKITGPKKIYIKGTLNLTCLADSTPSPRFTWFFNGTETARNSAEYIKEEVTLSDSGSYTCQARNDVTERTSSSGVHGLTVTDKPPSCAAGCIAGIVIACCIIMAAAVGGGYYIYKRNTHLKKFVHTDTTTAGQDNAASSNQELNYADINFFPTRNGERVQVGLQNDSALYAQVQLNSRAPAASTLPTYDAHMNRAKRPAPQPDTSGAQIYAQIRKH